MADIRKMQMSSFEPKEGGMRVTPSGGAVPIGQSNEDKLEKAQTQNELEKTLSSFDDMQRTESVMRTYKRRMREIMNNNAV